MSRIKHVKHVKHVKQVNFNLDLTYKTKISGKEQERLYKLWKKTSDDNIRIQLCVGFFSLICHLLSKYNLHDYDCTIIVLNKLYNKLPSYKPTKSSLYTYYYHIITNQAIDILRKNRKYKVDYVGDIIERISNNANYATQDPNINELTIKDLLPEDEYKCILAHYFGHEKPDFNKNYYNLCVKCGILRLKKEFA
jgi:subtilase family serine protease